jgi:hypothetical protein
MLVHNVFFWLKKDLTQEQTKLFEEKLEALAHIECIEDMYWGKPTTIDRPVVDKSYSYALTILCNDMAAHDAYQVDPLHKDFLEHCKTFWDKVVIYDAE